MEHSEGFLKLVEEVRRRIHEISVEETRERLEAGEGARLIDVREDNEWEAGHIEGALHIPLSYIAGEVPYFRKGKPIVTYCT